MKAVLLCPGPSLKNLTALPPCDVSVGVNRAATAFAVDYFAASDYPTLRDWQDKVLGNPKLFTRQQTYLDIRQRLRFKIITLMESLPPFPVKNWDGWTATAALALLHSLGAKEIDVYGADWAVEAADWDGAQVVGTIRTAERFEREIAVWQAMAAVLAERGVTVRRITVPDIECRV